MKELVQPVLYELPGVKNIEILDDTTFGEIFNLHKKSTARTYDVNIVVYDTGCL
jgi:hypothetical protein